MRKIKFRGKTISTAEWVYGSVVVYDNGAVVMSSSVDGWYERRYVEPDTVGQYVGVEDEYGHSIYEGDILKVEDILGNEFECAVVFDNNYHHAFGLHDICRNWYHFREIESMTIIGNIHDNPELLKEEWL